MAARSTASERLERQLFLRAPDLTDEPAFRRLVAASRRFHAPWVSAPATRKAFRAYLDRCATDAFRGLLLCDRDSGQIIGVFNLSQIFRGGFQNAYLGYWCGAEFAGRGYMSRGLRLLLRFAFQTEKLHRIEANIQPGNAASIALARSAGFRLEGFSPRYLKIAGRWRDHERWAICREDWRERRRARA